MIEGYKSETVSTRDGVEKKTRDLLNELLQTSIDELVKDDSEINERLLKLLSNIVKSNANDFFENKKYSNDVKFMLENYDGFSEENKDLLYSIFEKYIQEKLQLPIGNINSIQPNEDNTGIIINYENGSFHYDFPNLKQ